MEWLTGTAGPAFGRSGRPPVPREYIAIYIVRTMRRRPLAPTVVASARPVTGRGGMAPIPGVADGVDPAAGANRAGGACELAGTLAPLISPRGAGDGGRTAVSGAGDDPIAGPPEFPEPGIIRASRRYGGLAVTAGSTPSAAATAAVWSRMRMPLGAATCGNAAGQAGPRAPGFAIRWPWAGTAITGDYRAPPFIPDAIGAFEA